MRSSRKRKDGATSYLDGQLLVAMPIMTDKRFARSVIYMCAHSAEGAMGLIVNQRASHISFDELLKQLGIMPGNIDVPESLDRDGRARRRPRRDGTRLRAAQLGLPCGGVRRCRSTTACR